VRQAIFNIVEHGLLFSFDGARVADVFAGSGAMGMEALSRGAKSLTLVESHPQAAQCIRSNIATLNLHAPTALLMQDVCTLPRSQEPFDLIFLDPPYGKGLEYTATAHLMQSSWIGSQTLVVIETQAQSIPTEIGLTLQDKRVYGRVGLSFWQGFVSLSNT
jgi:16S rRNA (guanine966-N2)-methyltransferase